MHKILHTLLDKYFFRCERYNLGCTATIPYKNLKHHDKECGYQTTSCKYLLCNKMTYFKDLKIHQAKCEYQESECKYCKFKGVKKIIDNHEPQCDQRVTNCSGCDRYFKMNEIKRHVNICQEITDFCKRCKIKLKRKNLKTHSEIDCIRELYNETKVKMSQQIKDLRMIIARMEKKLKQRNEFFGTKCTNCNKFACEVSRKNCNHCLKPYCIPCSKRNTKGCKSCEAQVCMDCLGTSDLCLQCSNNLLKETEKMRNDKMSQNIFNTENQIDVIE